MSLLLATPGGGGTNATVSITGVQGSANVGLVSAIGGAVIAISALAGTGGVGTVSPVGNATVSISSSAASGAVGATTQTIGATASITAAPATGTVGTTTQTGNAAISITAQASTGAVGNTSQADGATVDGATAAVVGGGIGHGDKKKGKNKKPVLIKIDEYESPVEVIRQIEEKYRESVKKSANKPKVKIETPLADPSINSEQWVLYYKAMAENLATQRDYRQMLDLIARASLSIQQEAERQDEERQEQEMITLLLVAL